MATCSTQIAVGALADLGAVEEVCYGNKPVSPSLKTVRRRSTTLGLTKDSYSSEEIRSDRMQSDLRHGTRRAGGDIVTEVSPGSHADFMEALLGGVWYTPVAIDISDINLTAITVGDTVEVTASSFDFIAAQMYVGAPVTFTSTGTTALNGKLFTVISHDTNKIVLLPPVGLTYSSPASLTTGTFHIMGARVGMGNIYRSFTFERAFTDIGKFLVFTGMRANSYSVDLPPTGIATGTFNFRGKDAAPLASASIDGVAEIVKDATDMTSLTFDGAAGTITRGTGSWITDGYQVGDRIIIDGTGISAGQNRNPRTITEVTSATVIKVAEAIQTGGPYTTPFTVTRVGLPNYALAGDEQVLAAVSGVMLINGAPAATVTAMSFSIDNQMGGAEVVGSNVIPANLFGNQCVVSGSQTVLFDRGGIGETLYNAFDAETDNISQVMRLDKADGSGGLTFVFPRTKPSSGTLGDAEATGIPVSTEFTSLKPLAADPELGTSQVYIYDTTVTGVEPPTAAVTLTKVSETGGVATLKVEGGVAPYSFVFDTSETPILVPVAGEFTHDYVSNATYASTISDASTPTKTANLSVVITSV